MKYPIHDIKGEVLFEAEIECDRAAPNSQKKRLAVQWAVSNEKSMAGADLRGTYLYSADLQGADLSGADIRYANFRSAFLEGVKLPNCDVKIENIHQKVYEAASQPGALDMDDWHICDTTHCRAGWVVHLAGKAGYELEEKHGTAVAALMIYRASDPDYHEVPDFYAPHTKALDDMKRLAAQEAATDAG